MNIQRKEERSRGLSVLVKAEKGGIIAQAQCVFIRGGERFERRGKRLKVERWIGFYNDKPISRKD